MIGNYSLAYQVEVRRVASRLAGWLAGWQNLLVEGTLVRSGDRSRLVPSLKTPAAENLGR